MKASREQTKGLTSSGNVEIFLFSCIGEAKENKRIQDLFSILSSHAFPGSYDLILFGGLLTSLRKIGLQARLGKCIAQK